VLRHHLPHPPLPSALAATGHGSRVLLADAGYAHAALAVATGDGRLRAGLPLTAGHVVSA
jgi:hypothetical protein